jgi:DNA-directed RNA polymerase specialized sigma24 family protein
MSRQRLTSGVCRFCRCTDDRGCENGCHWIDDGHTVCSECEDLNRAPAAHTLISKISDDQLDRLAYHRERGVSIAAIAKRYGLSVGNLRWHFLISGVDPERAGPPPRPIPESPVVQTFERHGRRVEMRRYTVAEDALLLELEGQGLKYGHIARRLGRKRNSIVGRLATLARRAARTEETENVRTR